MILAASELARCLGVLFAIAAITCFLGCVMTPGNGWGGKDEDDDPP